MNEIKFIQEIFKNTPKYLSGINKIKNQHSLVHYFLQTFTNKYL